jgi:hypothetical protein
VPHAVRAEPLEDVCADRVRHGLSLPVRRVRYHFAA